MIGRFFMTIHIEDALSDSEGGSSYTKEIDLKKQF